MTVSSMLRAYLLGDAGISALVGTRVYPKRIPQGATYPLLVITKISGVRQGHLNGPASLAQPRYQIDAWVKSGTGSASNQADELGALVRRRMEALVNGEFTDTSVSPSVSLKVQVQFLDERDVSEDDVDDGFYRHSSDYYVWHQTSGGIY